MKNNNFILKEFLDNAFNLKSHLMEYLSIKECDLDGFLSNAKMNLANSHPGDALNDVSDFYTEIVGDRHVATCRSPTISCLLYTSPSPRDRG